MPSLAAIIVLVLVALGLYWKLRCIWRGCSIEPDSACRQRNEAKAHMTHCMARPGKAMTRATEQGEDT